MISAVNYWLNMFPQKDSVSNTVSPCTLLTVLTMNYNCYCHLEFGKYVQTHEECNNSMDPRMVGAFALQPTGNIKGGYFFLSLSTGKVLNQLPYQCQMRLSQGLNEWYDKNMQVSLIV